MVVILYVLIDILALAHILRLYALTSMILPVVYLSHIDEDAKTTELSYSLLSMKYSVNGNTCTQSPYALGFPYLFPELFLRLRLATIL